MVIFRFAPIHEPPPAVRGEGVYLRVPQMSDHAAWAALREESRAFLEPWEPIWPSDDLTKAAFRRRVRRYQDDLRRDVAYPFLLFREGDNTLLGGLTLGLVRRGVAQACTLGYWVGMRHARKGYMLQGVKAALRFAFMDLGLQRVEAACLPTNMASIGLLEKAGFQREGYARRYLCIAGVWQDHLLFACLKDDLVL